MEVAIQDNYSKSDLEAISACKMFLQITTFAEMVNDKGDSILPQAISRDLPNHRIP
jgi:hypothetical protein